MMGMLHRETRDDDVAGAVSVGMSVFFGGPAMGGPAGVTDAIAAIGGVHLEDILQVAEFTGSAANT